MTDLATRTATEADFDEVEQGTASAVKRAFAPGKLRWSVFKNSAAQAAGRVIISASRLVVLAVIVRGLGKTIFAEYTLLFTILSIAEWLVDFGTSEIFVREVCREPSKARRLLSVLTASKIVQFPLTFVLVLLFLVAMRYPAHLVEAGAVGGLGLLFFAGVLVYRVVFRATLSMEREVTAEFISVMAALPLVVLVVHMGGGLIALMVCHLISRAIFFGLAFVFGKKQYRFTLESVTWPDVRWGLNISTAIGISGFIVLIYETLDVLVLSRLSTMSDVAYYSGAQKFVWPLLWAQAAIGWTAYSVLSAYWPARRRDFEQTLQHSINVVFLTAGLGIAPLVAGAPFFMGLLGKQLVAGAPALEVLAALCFVKAISSTLGPVFYVINEQKLVLKLIVVATAVKATVSILLAPRFGYLGVALGGVGVDTLCIGIPVIFLATKLTQHRASFAIPLKCIGSAAVAVAIPRLLLGWSPLWSAVAAVVLYVILAIALRTFDLSELRSLLKWRSAAPQSP